MTSSRMALRIGAALALIAVLAGCDERKNPGYQGWVEADMIFVSPDESGRVIKLNVREGEDRLFAIIARLRKLAPGARLLTTHRNEAAK